MLCYFEADAMPGGLLGRLLSGVSMIHMGKLHALSGLVLNLLSQRIYLLSVLLVGRG